MPTDAQRSALEGIVYDEPSGLMICEECSHPLDSVKSLRSHLSTQAHAESRHISLSSKTIREIVLTETSFCSTTNVLRLPKCLGGRLQTVLHRKYRNNNPTEEPLPRISQLPVEWGWRCPHCSSFMSLDQERVRLHMYEEHDVGEEQFQKTWNLRSKVAMQTIGLGKRKHFFEVSQSLMTIVDELGGNDDVLPEGNGMKGETQNGSSLPNLSLEVDHLFEDTHWLSEFGETLEGEERSKRGDKECEDVALEELASRNNKEVNLTTKRARFPSTLMDCGFLTLGTVPTLFAYSPTRMRGALKKHQKNCGQNEMSCEGKCGARKVSGKVVCLMNRAVQKWDAVEKAEEEIVEAVKTYLNDAGRITDHAPNFHKALVVPHNGIARQARLNKAGRNERGQNYEFGNATTGLHGGQGVVLAQGSYFKVLSNQETVCRYARRIAEMIACLTRLVLVTEILEDDQSGGAEMEGGDGREEKRRSRCAPGEDIVKDLLSSLPKTLLDAVRLYWCAYGICMHEDTAETGSAELESSVDISSLCFRTSQNRRNELDQIINPGSNGAERRKALDILHCFSPVRISIHFILRNCFYHQQMSDENDTNQFWTKRFMALSSIDDRKGSLKHLRFFEAKELTPLTASLAYASRCSGIVELARSEETWSSWFVAKPSAPTSDSYGTNFTGNFTNAINLPIENAGVMFAEEDADFDIAGSICDLEMPRHREGSIVPVELHTERVEDEEEKSVVSIGREIEIENDVELADILEELITDDRKSGTRSKATIAEERWLLNSGDVHDRLSLCQNTAISYLFDIHTTLRGVAGNEEATINFMLCNRPDHARDKCGLVEGHEYSMKLLSEAVRSWQAEAKQLLQKSLLFGLELPQGFYSRVRQLNDTLSANERKSNVFTLESNKKWSTDCGKAVLRHILSTEHLRLSFVKKTKNGSPALRETAGNNEKSRHGRRIVFDPRKMQEYLDSAQKLQRLLLTLLHVTGGGTGRGTEQGYLLRNSAYARRNLFVMQGEALFIGRYNKSEGVTGKQKLIARYPDSTTSDLFVQMFLFVRPLEMIFIQKMMDEKLVLSHGDFCFVDRGVPFGAKKRRALIAKTFVDAGLPFQFRQYRHFQVGIAKRYLSREILTLLQEELEQFGREQEKVLNGEDANDHEDGSFQMPMGVSNGSERVLGSSAAENTTRSAFPAPSPVIAGTGIMNEMSHIFPIHEQASHSRETGNNVYAITASDVIIMGNVQLQQYRKVSRAWQSLLGLNRGRSMLTTTEARNVGDGNQTQEVAKAEHSYLQPEALVAPDTPHTRACPEKKIDGTSLRPLRPHSQQRSLRPDIMAGVPKATIENEILPLYESRQSEYSRSVYPRVGKFLMDTRLLPNGFIGKALKMLHEMYSVPKVNFKTQEQLLCFYTMLLRDSDLIVVMPTGMGKTAIVLLTAFAEASRMRSSFLLPHSVMNRPEGFPRLTIIVVPLLALASDILTRCKTFGILAMQWPGSAHNINSISVLVVSVEKVVSTQFAAMLGYQANRGRLSRIVIDEAHLSVEWDDFRPAFSTLRTALSPGGYAIPKIMMSATIPPEMSSEVAERHGSTSYREIRCPTVRDNLVYEVQVIEASRFESVEQLIFQAVETRLSEEICLLYRKFKRDSKDARGNAGNTRQKKLYEHNKAQIIVFCPTRNLRRQLENACSSPSVPQAVQTEVMGFDAKLSDEEKHEVLLRWQSFQSVTTRTIHGREVEGELGTESLCGEEEGENEGDIEEGEKYNVQIVLATCAFGTGIDSPCVRTVIHAGYSRSVSEYVQESGRAGRDGQQARCVLLFSDGLWKREFSMATAMASERLESLRLDSLTKPTGSIEAGCRQKYGLLRFKQWALNRTMCRRQSLFHNMDGMTPVMCIFSRKGTEDKSADEKETFCDYCKNVMKESVGADAVDTGGVQSVPNMGVKLSLERGHEEDEVVNLTLRGSDTDAVARIPPHLPDDKTGALHGNASGTGHANWSHDLAPNTIISFPWNNNKENDAPAVVFPEIGHLDAAPHNVRSNMSLQILENHKPPRGGGGGRGDGGQGGASGAETEQPGNNNRARQVDRGRPSTQSNRANGDKGYHHPWQRNVRKKPGEHSSISGGGHTDGPLRYAHEDVVTPRRTTPPIPSTMAYGRREDLLVRRPLQRQEAKSLFRDFLMKCWEIGDLCIPCFATKGIKRAKDICGDKCLKWSCYRCSLPGHRSADCELIPFRPMPNSTRHFAPLPEERRNHCYACGMLSWQGVNMHEKEQFSRVISCPFIPAIRLALAAWCDRKRRKELVQRFSLERLDTNEQSIGEMERNVHFLKWLRSESAAERNVLNVMRVISFLWGE